MTDLTPETLIRIAENDILSPLSRMQADGDFLLPEGHHFVTNYHRNLMDQGISRDVSLQLWQLVIREEGESESAALQRAYRDPHQLAWELRVFIDGEDPETVRATLFADAGPQFAFEGEDLAESVLGPKRFVYAPDYRTLLSVAAERLNRVTRKAAEKGYVQLPASEVA